MQALLAFFLPLFSVNAHAIPNGIEIDESEYPEVVSLWSGTSEMKSFFCSGSMVKAKTKTMVLTAAHCAIAAEALMPNFQPNPFAVYVNYKNQYFKITKPYYPNEYVTRSKYFAMDVGFLDFDQPLNGIPDALELDFSDLNPYDPVTLVGYGANQAYTKVREKFKLESEEDFKRKFDQIQEKPYWEVGAGIKRKGNNQIPPYGIETDLFRIIGHSFDERVLGFFSKPTGENVTFAHGDSGAPLIRNGKLIGVCSSGSDPDSGNRPEHTATAVRLNGIAREYIEEALRK